MQTAERLSACRARSLSGAASVFCYECYGHPDGCRNLKTICTVILSTAYLGNVQYYTKLLSGRAQIDLHEHYQKQRHQHFQALVSAYRRSPYFSYYEERFAVVYRKRHDFLVDLNEELQSLVLELLRADPPVGHTERYAEHVPEGEDFRHCISRKPRLSRPDPDFAPQPYYQVFSERMPFVPNLSIVDLLFCEGPSAAGVLAASVPSAGVHPSLAR